MRTEIAEVAFNMVHREAEPSWATGTVSASASRIVTGLVKMFA